MSDEMMDTAAAGEYLAKTGRWLELGRHKGYGPPYLKIGRSVRYRRRDLDKYLAERVFTSTAEYSPSEAT